MSQLKKKIEEQYVAAVKGKDAFSVSVFRLIRAAIKNKEIDTRKPLNEDKDIIDIIKKMMKQNAESLEQFQKGKRADLVEKTQKEISLLQTFLPKQLSKEELKKKIQATITQTGASSLKDMGKVIQEVSKNFGSQADMKEVSSIVRDLLPKA
ncbi:MAG: GatB/YqeY domain-containing protein [Deltaproteobacteria bacterium]|nr:GatB/YqeY domain-containing protein [Deltaproteobacteria bacterium]